MRMHLVTPLLASGLWAREGKGRKPREVPINSSARRTLPAVASDDFDPASWPVSLYRDKTGPQTGGCVH
jgi:hypothetical protein